MTSIFVLFFPRAPLHFFCNEIYCGFLVCYFRRIFREQSDRMDNPLEADSIGVVTSLVIWIHCLSLFLVGRSTLTSIRKKILFNFKLRYSPSLFLLYPSKFQLKKMLHQFSTNTVSSQTFSIPGMTLRNLKKSSPCGVGVSSIGDKTEDV